MAKSPAVVTEEEMEASCAMALALDRAYGVPIPHHKQIEGIYSLGFVAGALWALRLLKEEK